MMTMSSTEHGPLADTMWRLTELMPWFAAADAKDPAHRQPMGIVALGRLQDDHQSAIAAHLAMTRSAVEHASQAATRFATARNPMDALVAQTGLGLAMAELAAAPLRAWLEVIPKLHACCMTMTSDPPAAASSPSEAEAEGASARSRSQNVATHSSKPA